MSEMEEFSAYRAEDLQDKGLDPMVVLPASEGSNGHTLKEIEESLDGQSYFLGEVPQQFRFDPHSFLPLNSDRLIGTVNMAEKTLADVSMIIDGEVEQIQKFQKKINFWEDRIEKNKTMIQKNQNKVKQNLIDVSYDKKNRDYWWSRAEQVTLDYQTAAASNRETDWAWLVKKYALKNADGTQIDPTHVAVDELCNGEANNLAAQYRMAGDKYEQSKKDREIENNRLIRENANFMNTNDLLQNYIANTYRNDIEPLQDGVLLMKELGVKLKSLGQEGSKATYGELRAWAEQFLNDFLKSNPRVSQSMVTEFRKLTSIPLPADHC
jgi:hypothetical protein